MASFYVHGDYGDDANSGTTPASPKATISMAAVAASSGDTIYVKGGITYHESVYFSKSLTFLPYSTDYEKPIMEPGDTSYCLYANYTSEHHLTVKNFIFHSDKSTQTQGIKIGLNDDYGSSTNIILYVYNCDFYMDRGNTFVPRNSNGIHKEGLGGWSVIDHCTFYRCNNGIYLQEPAFAKSSSLSRNTISNSIFMECGNQESQSAGIYGYATNSGSNIFMAEHKACYFYACGLNTYSTLDGAIWNSATYPSTVTNTVYPQFEDTYTYDFRIKSTSPCVDIATGSNDAHVPPAVGTSSPDIGSYGGTYNLDYSGKKTVTIDGVDYDFSQYEQIDLTGKDFFVEWVGDAAILSLIADVYSKSTTLYFSSSPSDGLSITSLQANEVKMSSGKLNLEIEKGATFSRTFIWRDANGDVIDVSSGYTSVFEVKDRVGGTSLVSLSESSGITLGASTIVITISSSVTGAVTQRYGVFEFTITKTSTSKVTKLLSGKVEFKDSVI